MFDRCRSIGIGEMDGSEAKRIQKTVSRCSTAVFLERSDTTTHVDGGFLAESASFVNVIEEDDGTNHTTETEHVGLIRGEFLLANHFFTDVGHDLQSGGDALAGDGLMIEDEFGGGAIDHVHHGCGVGEEERHAIGELVLDEDVHVLLLGLHPVEGATVVRKIVLDGRIDHLQVIKAKNEIKDLSDLLDQSLALAEHLFGVVLAECSKEFGESSFELR